MKLQLVSFALNIISHPLEDELKFHFPEYSVNATRSYLQVFGGGNARIEGQPIRGVMPGIGMRDLSVSYSPIEVSGEVEAVACVLRDITDMKRIESVESGWRKRLELAKCAGLRIGLWDWDIRENTVVWSDESYRQWGFTRATFSSKVADAVPRIHPADRSFVDSAIRKVIARETDEYEAQYRVLRPDGSICWVDARGVMVGASKRMIGIGIDITDHIKTPNPTSHSASDVDCLP